MQCSDSRLLIHAYLDNELDAGDSVRLNRHLADCAACARELERQSLLQDALGRARPALASSIGALPESIRTRILASLPSSEAASAATALPLPRPRSSMHRRQALPFAIAASALLLLGGGFGVAWQRHVSATSAASGAAMIAEVVSDHVRSLQPQHLTDVLTSDQHTVKPWFDGKLDFSPQVKDLDATGFVLVGGRLDVLQGQRVAAIVYRRRSHPINLFQFVAPGPDTAPTSNDAGDGYTTTSWRRDGIAYWAVSTLDRGEMETFAGAFRASPAPSAPR